VIFKKSWLAGRVEIEAIAVVGDIQDD